MASACANVTDTNNVCSTLEATGVGFGAFLGGIFTSNGFIGAVIILAIASLIFVFGSAIGKFFGNLFSGMKVHSK